MLGSIEKYAEKFGFNRMHFGQNYIHYIKNEGQSTIIMTHELDSKYVTFFDKHKQKTVRASDLVWGILYDCHV